MAQSTDQDCAEARLGRWGVGGQSLSDRPLWLALFCPLTGSTGAPQCPWQAVLRAEEGMH